MHARLQDADPEHHTHDHVDGNATHAEYIQHHQRRCGCCCHRQRQHRELTGIEQRNDDHRTEIVHHCQRQHEGLQGRRHAGAQQGQHTQRKGNVGRRWNGPALQQYRIMPVQRGIDQRRHDHAAQRGKARQRQLTQAAQMAVHDFALDLQAHHEKEQSHQAVIDPEQ